MRERATSSTLDRMGGSPQAEYERRLEDRRLEAAAASRRRITLARSRLAVFALGLGVLWLALVRPEVAMAWVILPLAGFVVLVVSHDNAARRLQRAERAARFYESGIARLEYRFAGTGRDGARFADPSHPYTEHLDVFGRGGLFELLCRSQTTGGEHRLADWLTSPAEPEEIRARQAAVRELSSALDLREDLAVLGPEVRAAIEAGALSEWGSSAPELSGALPRVLAFLLASGAALAAAGALWFDTGLPPLALVVLAELALWGLYRGRVHAALAGLERALRELRILQGMLSRLERERFEAPRLVELMRALETEGTPPSGQIRRLVRLVSLLDARRNQLFAPIAPFLMWTTQLAFGIEGWRASCGPHLGEWIDVVSEFEALCDLAGHAYEHPDDPFPEISDDGPRFAARGLGHPLLPESACVRNDLALEPDHALLVVSGSNMSGKSTLLRSVGSNTVLALAGAPVRAEQLTLSPLAIGASLRIVDSLQEGSSRFYAEISCLRRTMELCDDPRPVLFLLDEILGGTNSHDRGVGAAAVVRGLVQKGAIGLVTTHDLALTSIADELAPRARNVHFEDQLEDGRMSFDYHLREGIVRKSNALELMRAVGLEV